MATGSGTGDIGSLAQTMIVFTFIAYYLSAIGIGIYAGAYIG